MTCPASADVDERWLPDPERLWSRVKEVDGCLIWQGTTAGRLGHGVLREMRDGKRVQFYVHRLAWEYENGPIPDGMAVVRECYQPACCNPEHLRLCTLAEASAHARNTKERTDPVERFWSYVEKSPTCWLWKSTTTASGYGVFATYSPDGPKQVRAHRYAYELVVGPIPEGLVLDHLCRVQTCVNPAHLEPVENGENVLRGFSQAAINARKKTCAHGHEFTPTVRFKRGKWREGRVCVPCKEAWSKNRKNRKKATTEDDR